MKSAVEKIAALLAANIAALAALADNAHEREIVRPLNKTEIDVMLGRKTEPPFTNKYCNFFGDGLYVCRRCGAPLYRSADKFDSGCGWPAFDDEMPQAVKRSPDPDGRRTEISCARCGAHLGHVFEGEKLTAKNVRHCVNSASMDFIPAERIGRAVVAGGCFWGVEELMRRLDGVLSARSGYCGGTDENPTYRRVCSGNTGHLESVEILFDTSRLTYADVLRRFFEIHDFSQADGQGPDIGAQYLSAVFAQDGEQKKCAQDILEQLRSKGFSPATKILPPAKFYPAEAEHQRYYERKKKSPYCHFRREIF